MGLLQYRDANWVRNGAALTRRVDPTWNQMGAMTGFGYGAVGSLYSYAHTFDNAWRPVGMTGEGLGLVSGVGYNAAGAMTGFTRDDGSGTAVNIVYGFNALYQMTNQTVTKGGSTLQNLTYAFSATQNNGQVLSQTDAVSGETVEYAYDALNRLATAQTTGPQWGLQFSYDGFGNRTNQTVTKGSGPTHSVAIDGATNRVATAGYLYDANGNMTQMPQLTMGYDVANRMVTSNHAAVGTQSYGYNQANQRVFVRSGSTVTYMLYGLGGERLMEFAETCAGGACNGYQETQRWIYFAGRKMFSKTGTTLKAITPNRLASEAKHFPYGETDGTPPSDTKDYFATYRRDSTGLDYAWNRYYSPTMGRLTTADPYGGSVNPGNPQSWARYSYTENNPGNWIDPSGLNLQHLVPIADGGGWATDASLSGPWGPWGDWGPWWPPLPDHGQFWLPEPELPSDLPEPVIRGDRTIAAGRSGGYPVTRSSFVAVPIIIEVGAHILLRPETQALLVLLAEASTRIFSRAQTSTYPTEQELINRCSPGRTLVEPATGRRYRGGMSYEQEYVCDPPISGLSVYTMHWIIKNEVIVHGPHVRPGPPKGGGSD